MKVRWMSAVIGIALFLFGPKYWWSPRKQFKMDYMVRSVGDHPSEAQKILCE